MPGAISVPCSGLSAAPDMPHQLVTEIPHAPAVHPQYLRSAQSLPLSDLSLSSVPYFYIFGAKENEDSEILLPRVKKCEYYLAD